MGWGWGLRWECCRLSVRASVLDCNPARLHEGSSISATYFPRIGWIERAILLHTETSSSSLPCFHQPPHCSSLFPWLAIVQAPASPPLILSTVHRPFGWKYIWPICRGFTNRYQWSYVPWMDACQCSWKASRHPTPSSPPYFLASLCASLGRRWHAFEAPVKRKTSDRARNAKWAL